MNTAVKIPNLIERVYQFNRDGQITPPGHFNADRVGFYTGMQCEELAEKIQAIAAATVNVFGATILARFSADLQALGKEFKSGMHYGAVLRADREELLDGDVDILVVSAGALVYQTPQFAGAVEAVLFANDDKKFKEDGMYHHDADGKIIKRPGWTRPDLAPFVDHTGEE